MDGRVDGRTYGHDYLNITKFSKLWGSGSCVQNEELCYEGRETLQNKSKAVGYTCTFRATCKTS